MRSVKIYSPLLSVSPLCLCDFISCVVFLFRFGTPLIFVFVIVVLLSTVGPTCMRFEVYSSAKINIMTQITVLVVSEERAATIFREGYLCISFFRKAFNHL
jgi:hypothetical protein